MHKNREVRLTTTHNGKKKYHIKHKKNYAIKEKKQDFR